MRRASAAALVLALLLVAVACQTAPGPTVEPPPPASEARPNYAATAVVLARQPTRVFATPVPVPGSGPFGRGTPLPTASAGTVGGRVAVVRDDALVVREAGQERTVFRADSGGQVKDPAFSPDGATVAFAYAPPRLTPGPTAGPADQFVADLLLVDAAGGPSRVVVGHDAPGAILEMPTWSSDGRALYYSYYVPTYRNDELIAETAELRRREMASGATTTVSSHGGGGSPAPDGRTVAFIGESSTESVHLDVVGADGAGERTLVAPGRFVAMLAPRFSPDGATVVFSAAAAPAPAASPRASSPLDALRRALVSVAEAHGLSWEIWMVPAAGGTPRQLTALDEDAPTAAWSRDGRRLLVYGAAGLYLVDPGAGQTSVVERDGSHGGMDWWSQP